MQRSLILDRAHLRSMTANDESLMREITSELVNSTARQIALLYRAVEESDLQACKGLAHESRGVCAMVGAAAMAGLFRAIELQAMHDDLSGCRSSLQQLCVALAEFRCEAISS